VVPGIEPGVTELVDRRLSTGTVSWSTRLSAYSDAQAVWPAGGNLIVAEEPGTATPPTALAVDPATGKIRAAATLVSLVSTPLTVAGGDTLMEMVSAPCPGGPVPGSITSSSHP
jgi:hypothetical protein